MRIHFFPLFAALFLGCGGDEADTDTTDTTTDTAIGGTVPSDSPVLENCDASCRLHQVDGGESFFQWSMACGYSDPQGDGTVQSVGQVEISQNGVFVGLLDLYCGVDPDEGAQCTRDAGADDIGVSCNVDPESYQFEFTVYDLDGNPGTAVSMGRAVG
jgi:hypothetical protein